MFHPPPPAPTGRTEQTTSYLIPSINLCVSRTNNSFTEHTKCVNSLRDYLFLRIKVGPRSLPIKWPHLSSKRPKSKWRLTKMVPRQNSSTWTCFRCFIHSNKKQWSHLGSNGTYLKASVFFHLFIAHLCFLIYFGYKPTWYV